MWNDGQPQLTVIAVFDCKTCSRKTYLHPGTVETQRHSQKSGCHIFNSNLTNSLLTKIVLQRSQIPWKKKTQANKESALRGRQNKSGRQNQF